MSSKFIFFTALRYFYAKKNEKFVSIISAISLLGITVGVAALIIVMSVMNGFHVELTSNIVGLNGDITVNPADEIIENYREVIKTASKQEFVKKVIPIVVGQALALGPSNNSGVIIKGIDIVDLKNKGEILGNVFHGNFSEYHGLEAVAIGLELANNLGIYAGSKVKLIAPNLLSTAFGSLPRSKTFTVAAIFSSGMYDYDAATILMPLEAAQKFLSLGSDVNQLEISIVDRDKTSIYADILQKELGPNVTVRSWLELNLQFLNALKIERTAMFMILSLIILVAAFNIISSLFMLVKDKTKDIAILKTIGASVKQIMLIFIVNGMLIGIIGTSCGIALGLLFAKNIENIRLFLEKISGTKIFDPAIYFLYSLPSVVRISDVIAIVLLALILSFLATLYPAYRAATLNPVEAMRYE